MKTLLCTLLITILALTSCSNVELQNVPRERSLSGKVEKINGEENLPVGVAQLLEEEQNLHNKDLWSAGAFSSNINPEYVPEANPKFPLPYYLIPEEDADFLQAISLDKKVSKQLQMMIDGKKYFKLFVHPESEAHYAFLKRTHSYISANKTEFSASPTSSYRSLIVWNHNAPNEKAFIAKVSLDKNVIGSIDRLVSANEVERSIANQKVFDAIGEEELDRINVKIYPESAGLTIHEKLPGAPDKLGGQLIREIPNEVVTSKRKWFSFSALMSPNKNPPLIMEVIQASRLSAYDFFDRYMIDSYMKMFEELSLVKGINFEPHSQNLSFETGMDLAPTGKWVIRDFGGVWPDVVTMAKNHGPAHFYMDSANATKFKLLGGRANSISSYVFFYKRQVFDMMLKEVAKFDNTLTPKKITELNKKINALVVKKFNKHLGLNLVTAPNMSDYKSIEKKVLEKTVFDSDVKHANLQSNAYLDQLLEKKKETQEWIEFNSKGKKATHFVLTDHGIYELQENKVIGLAFFNEEEKNEFKAKKGFVEFLNFQAQNNGLTCEELLSRLLGR